MSTYEAINKVCKKHNLKVVERRTRDPYRLILTELVCRDTGIIKASCGGYPANRQGSEDSHKAVLCDFYLRRYEDFKIKVKRPFIILVDFIKCLFK